MKRQASRLAARATCVLAAVSLAAVLSAATSMAAPTPASAGASCSKPVVTAVGPFPPYVYQDAQRQWSGIDIDMAQAIFQEAGCTLAFATSMPATRYITLFELGKVDMMLGASDTEERRRMARFSSAYRYESVALFALARDADRYRDIDGFAAIRQRGLTLLAPKAGWYGPAYASALPALRAGGHVSEFVTFSQGIRMIGAARATFIMGDSAAIRYEARRQHVALQALPQLALLNAAIERLEKNGKLRAIGTAHGEP